MFLKRFFSIIFISCEIYAFFSWEGVWASTFPLDEEAVFCLYYRLSGEAMNEEDMEDLCFELGRPTFTPHKPSEMFMKGSLIDLKDALTLKMQEFDGDSLFCWNVKCILTPKDKNHKYPRISFDKDTIPQPTPYIRSAISNKNLSLIVRRIHSLVVKRSITTTKKKIEDMIVYLRPEKIKYEFEKRNVAREKVVLPIRYVIFQPVKIKIFDEMVAITN